VGREAEDADEGAEQRDPDEDHTDLPAPAAPEPRPEPAAREPEPPRRGGRLVRAGRGERIGAGDRHQRSLERGSISAQMMSTQRFTSTNAVANSIVMLCTTGKSRWLIAVTSRRPRPGRMKICSMMTVPPSR